MSSQSSKNDDFIIYVDGACSGNPGDSSIGVVIRDTLKNREETISQYIGIATNNIAEYSALIAALERVLEMGAKRVFVRSDSELMVKQINGLYKVKNENLKGLYTTVVSIVKKFDSFKIEHVRREFNKEADKLAQKAITDYKRAGRMVASQ